MSFCFEPPMVAARNDAFLARRPVETAPRVTCIGGPLATFDVMSCSEGEDNPGGGTDAPTFSGVRRVAGRRISLQGWHERQMSRLWCCRCGFAFSGVSRPT